MNSISSKPVRREPTAEEDALARQVIGAAIEVHRVLGPGLLESVYEEALCVELEQRNVPFIRQLQVNLTYKDRPIGTGRLDLLVGDSVIVELKSVSALADVHVAQVLSYMRTTGYRLGLLINFNVPVLKAGLKRIVLT